MRKKRRENNPAGIRDMPKVMVIEDDANMFSLLQMLLEFEGYEVVLWEGREEIQQIVDAICQEKPELILMDVHLRHLNGFDVLRTLRNEPELDGVRVLIASGVDMTERSHQEGADGFILKPFMPDELISKIKLTIG
jgi:DNA-binding response OmpR family regulator